MTLTFDLKIKIQLCSCIIFSCTLVVKSDSDWSRKGKIWHGQGFITMVCYELEFLFRYWFKVTIHPLLTSPLMWRHGSDGTGEKNIVWTRLFIDVCYDLDLWPRNLILRSHYTLNPKVHFGCYKYQYAYESNLVKGKDYMVLTKILHINSLWPLPLTKKVGQRPLFTIHPKVLEPDKGGELMLLTNDMGQMKGQTDWSL